jgi:hypothetical protein
MAASDHVLPGAPTRRPKLAQPDDRATFKIPFFAFDRIGCAFPLSSFRLIAEPVEHRMLRHTSIIKTVSEIFGLNGPLNRRDERPVLRRPV